MGEASAAIAAGQPDKAAVALERAAKANPSSKEPWSKMAQMKFDAGDYPGAIVAASEVVQRDPGDQPAKGILVVAGLRVAARGVSDLRASDPVGTGTRGEAEQLTKALREVLGENVLVPPATDSEPALRAKSKVKNRPRVSPSASTKAPEPASAGASVSTSSGDPFHSLK